MESEPPPSILAKAFTLLEAFSTERRVMSLSEIGRVSGLPKSTVHRLLARLIEIGAIEQHRSGYRVGTKLLQISMTQPVMSLRDVASPSLAALHHDTGLTVYLAVLRGFEIVVVEKLSDRNSPASDSGTGSRWPANCSSLGKALLAYEDLDDLEMFLPDPMPSLTPASITDVAQLMAQLHAIRAAGIAHESQEMRVGLASTAVPIDVMGSAVASVAVAHPERLKTGSAVDNALRHTAVRISREVSAALNGRRIGWFPYEMDESFARDHDGAHRPVAFTPRGRPADQTSGAASSSLLSRRNSR